jgi:hypothetical protein
MATKKKNPLELEIPTDTDTYLVKIPTGDVGWKHLSLIMELESERASAIEEIRPEIDPETGEETEKVVRLPQPTEQKITMIVMEKWIKEVLPFILIDKEFDTIPWWDIPVIFAKVSETYTLDTKNFQPVQQ